MKGSYLGEFQEIVLLSILLLGQNAYGVSIQEEINSRLNRDISRGALHSALSRLEKKGYISSRIGGASAIRGGRSKKFYTLTNTGNSAVEETRDTRMSLWGAILKTST